MQRAHLAGQARQVAARNAEVLRGRCCSVEDVEGVCDAVAVRIDAVTGPGRGDELHRSDSPVVRPVAVHHTFVGVTNERTAGAVERDADDGGSRASVGVKNGVAESTVIGLDPTDRREQRPWEVALRRLHR